MLPLALGQLSSRVVVEALGERRRQLLLEHGIPLASPATKRAITRAITTAYMLCSYGEAEKQTCREAKSQCTHAIPH